MGIGYGLLVIGYGLLAMGERLKARGEKKIDRVMEKNANFLAYMKKKL